MPVKLPQLETSARPIPQPAGGIASYRGATGAETAGGEAQMRLGQEMGAAGDQIYVAFKAEEEKTNTLRAEEAFSKLRERQLDLTYGKENGFTHKRGSQALDRPLAKEYGDRFNQAYREIESGLANDDQKLKFKTRATAARLQFDEGMLRHLAQENDSYAKQVSDGAVKTEIAAVTANPYSTEAMLFGLERARGIIEKEVARQGLAGKAATDQVEIHMRRVQDAMWVARIEAIMYQQPMTADKLFRDNADKISDPQVRLQLQARTREAAFGVQGTMEAQKIIDEFRSSPERTAATTTNVGSAQSSTDVPRSVRNNNPGNIEKSATKWQGEVEGSDPRFVTFATREDGLRAMQKNLLTYQEKHGLTTVDGIIGRWAPASENGQTVTKNYVRTVAAAMGVEPNAPIDLRNPETMKKMVDAIVSVEAGGSSGGTRTAAMPGTDPMTANTSGLPIARDIAAELPLMLTRVEKRADALYGTDPSNPDRAAFVRRVTQELQAKVSAEVQQLNAIQRKNQGIIIEAIEGVGGASPGKGITSFSEIQANPVWFAAFQGMDSSAKGSALRMIESNQRGDKGNDKLYWETFERIHAKIGDPRKIELPGQLIELAGPGRLSPAQLNELRREMERDDSKSVTSLRVAAAREAERQFNLNLNTNTKFVGTKLTEPDAALTWARKWKTEVDGKVDALVAQGRPDLVRALFQADSKDYVLRPEYLQTFMTLGGQPLAAAAAQARAGQPAQTIAQPKEIDTREKLYAWFKTLPPDVTTFVGTDGKAYKVPPRGAQSAPSAPQPAAQPVPKVEMDPAGKIVTPPAPKHAMDPNALPKFAGSRYAVSPEEQARLDAHFEGLKAAAASVATTVGNAVIEAGLMGIRTRQALVEMVTGLAGTARRDTARATFQAVLEADTFASEDVPVIQAALKYGDLSAAERKKAWAMLKDAGVD